MQASLKERPFSQAYTGKVKVKMICDCTPPKLYLLVYLLVLQTCLQVLVPVSFIRHQISLKEGPFSYALSGKDKVKMMYPPKLHLLLSLLALQFCLQMPVLVFLARYQVPLHQSICLL